jgi:hypothetical protein
MEDMAKVLADKNTEQTAGKLEKILELPYIKEPQEMRSAEEFTIKGKSLICKDKKKK